MHQQVFALQRKISLSAAFAALFCVVFLVVGLTNIPQVHAAKSAQTLYQEADAYYKKLKGDRNIYKYRSNWETAINKFYAVYKQDKSGSLAPQALYRGGLTSLELYNFSKRAADKTSGINYLKQVITEFPASPYAKQAQDVLRKNNVADIPALREEGVLAPTKVKPPNVKNIQVAGAAGLDEGDAVREALESFNQQASVTIVETAAEAVATPANAVVAPAAATARAKEYYLEGEKFYTNLQKDREFRQTRKNWDLSLDAFESAYQTDRKGPWAPAALYAKAMVYKDLYHYFGSSNYLQQSKSMLQLIVRDYPNSSYSEKARIFDAQNGFKSFDGPSLITGVPNPDAPAATASTTQPAETNGNGTAVVKVSQGNKPDDTVQNQTTGDKSDLGPGQEVTVKPTIQTEGKVAVTEVRHWSNPQYTRVVIGLSGPTVYKYNLLNADRANKLPPRLYVDVEGSYLSSGVNKALTINDDLLQGARAAQYSLEDVRVVLDLKSFGSYKIFPLNDPFRIVIDIWGDKKGAATAQTQTSQPAITTQPPQTGNAVQPVDNTPVTVVTPPREGAIGTTDLAKQLGLGVKRIVIDPGHGGKDGGAPGFVKGVLEKNVVLQISLKLRDKIQKELGCEVIMTRTTDKYLSLEERMAIANSRNADLFVSIHTNASRNNKAYGIETYFLNLATDEESIRVAAMENATSTKGISDLQNILNDLMQNSKINESSRLATLVQNALVTNLKKNYGNKINNKGVKQAPFYVLLGATMPSILIETGFISNQDECKRLTDSKYQDAICTAIVAGIKSYIKELQPNR